MDLELRGEVAVVAGGAQGIGKAIAEEFAAEGADVAILDVNDAADTASLIESTHDVGALSLTCDIRDESSTNAARDAVLARWGRADHLVVAAAIGSGKYGFPFLNLEPSDWDRVLEVNVRGAVTLLHSFAPPMMGREYGSITMISSVAALFGSQTDPPYSASKAAMINFAQCAAKDLAPKKVRVNTVCPGMVKTALNRSVWESWNRVQAPEDQMTYEKWAGEKVRDVVPLGRWQEPSDVARMVVFLASKCAKNVTGQTVNVDGGYVMR